MASGTCGENLTWVLNSSGILTISGTVDMYNWYYPSSPWYSYQSNINSVDIGDGVTSIGDHAFYGCDALSDVYYGGSEEDWKKIVIGNYNTSLERAAIHYNSSMPGAEIIASGELDEGISWSIDSEGVFSMTAEETLSKYSSVSIGYSESGEIKTSATVSVGSARMNTKMNTEGVKTIKIFIWESIESMKPLCEAKVIEIE